jgi:regulatory protein
MTRAPTPAGERRLQGPEARLEQARALAWGWLNRRERTEAELRALLARKRVAPDDVEAVLAELLAGGYVDDARYAERFAHDRRNLDGWGAARIEQRLCALGIERELAAAAAGARTHEEELAAAAALLRRRLPQPPQTPRERDRALGILVRKGYTIELAHLALRRHAGPEEVD